MNNYYININIMIFHKAPYKYILTIFLLVTSMSFSFAQSHCKQDHANRLFSTQQFLAFTSDIDNSEKKLLSYDFCFQGTSKSDDGKCTYFQYRIDHTYNADINKYAFDSFYVSNDIDRFQYHTISSKNFLSYKDKLFKSGFSKVSNDKYEKKSGNNLYIMEVSRLIHEASRTPNYVIDIRKL